MQFLKMFSLLFSVALVLFWVKSAGSASEVS